MSGKNPRVWGGSHPELRDGEVFIHNIYDDHPGRPNAEFDALGLTTKRMGMTAYDSAGGSIDGLRPVFASQQEVEAAGIPVGHGGDGS